MATNQEKLDNINDILNHVNSPAFKAYVLNGGSPEERQAQKALAAQIASAVLWTEMGRSGAPGKTSLGLEISWIAQNFAGLRATVEAQTKSLISALSAVVGGEAFDEAKLLAGVKAAAEAGVKAAIDSIETTTTVNVKKEG